MAQKTFKLTITRVDGPLFDGEAVSVTVPGAAGEMTLLAQHEPLISPLKTGTVEVTALDGQKSSYQVVSGTLEVANNHITILV